jgi:hypothetical protein
MLQVGLLVAALGDLRRRPSAEVNGSKAIWAAVSFVNFLGPLAYFAFGRKRKPARRSRDAREEQESSARPVCDTVGTFYATRARRMSSPAPPARSFVRAHN